MNITSLLFVIAIVVILFILLREFVCWYYKVNERLENQREIIRLLKELNEKNKEEKKE